MIASSHSGLAGMASTCTAQRFSQLATHIGTRRSVRTMASRSIYVKGDPVAGKLGDCPFCHRALLTLEIKVCTPCCRQCIA